LFDAAATDNIPGSANRHNHIVVCRSGWLVGCCQKVEATDKNIPCSTLTSLDVVIIPVLVLLILSLFLYLCCCHHHRCRRRGCSWHCDPPGGCRVRFKYTAIIIIIIIMIVMVLAVVDTGAIVTPESGDHGETMLKNTETLTRRGNG
jgi:heme/copper-type cytochrome/quinol oxidase subunit 2